VKSYVAAGEALRKKDICIYVPMGMSTRGNDVNILVLGIASFAYKVRNTMSNSKHGKGMKRGKVGPRVFVIGTQRGWPVLQPKRIYIVIPFYPPNGTITPEVGNVVMCTHIL
jgi:hypothetical protein